jgi:hypothetical protein
VHGRRQHLSRIKGFPGIGAAILRIMEMFKKLNGFYPIFRLMLTTTLPAGKSSTLVHSFCPSQQMKNKTKNK